MSPLTVSSAVVTMNRLAKKIVYVPGWIDPRAVVVMRAVPRPEMVEVSSAANWRPAGRVIGAYTFTVLGPLLNSALEMVSASRLSASRRLVDPNAGPLGVLMLSITAMSTKPRVCVTNVYR